MTRRCYNISDLRYQKPSQCQQTQNDMQLYLSQKVFLNSILKQSVGFLDPLFDLKPVDRPQYYLPL